MRKTTDAQKIAWAVALTATSLVVAAPGSKGAWAAGYLYSVDNDTQQNGVAVIERNADGSLTEIPGSPFPTGGTGLGGGDIDQQGVIQTEGSYVLAVNPRSNSVAVLRKDEDGKLTPVAGSPFPSGGPAPLSLTVHGDLVYVSNQAPSFAHPSTAPNIMGFRMGHEGTLTPIANSTIAFPAGQGPAQVAFSPGGETVVVTSGFQAEAASNVNA
jgi:6-phosphogluconolactonase (cycloisomerase 2 family)